MESDNTQNYRRKGNLPAVVSLIALLLLAAGIIGWLMGNSSNQDSKVTAPTPTQTPVRSTNESSADVKSLITYTLPAGWSESVCSNTVYVLPSDVKAPDCANKPTAPIKITVDPKNAKDCNDIQNVQDVSKHICSSVFIDGRKTLKSETKYNKDSTYGTDTTLMDYYIDTGKGVVKVEYIFTTTNDYQNNLDDIAYSVKIKD